MFNLNNNLIIKLTRFRVHNNLKNIKILLLFLILCFHQIVIIDCKPNRPLLRGVTFRNWPYADRINDRYEGFIVDLMNLISQKVGFDYRLYFSPDGKYGTEFNGNINGMIGEVFRNRADFAIADLTVTESRKRYVDFTDAFLENQLAAIIRRDDAIGLRTLEDLVTLNEINHRPDLPPTERRGLLTYGTYRTGATYYHLSKNKDPIAKKIYEWMVRNPDALVTSAKEGFDRVNAGRYAFIVESTFAEYLTGIYCNLTMLYDTRSLYPRKFAIALPKNSPYLHGFNKAIRELKATGIIQRLRYKYWINRCSPRNDVNNNEDNHQHSHLQHPPPPPPTSKPQQQSSLVLQPSPSPPLPQQPPSPAQSPIMANNNNSTLTDINRKNDDDQLSTDNNNNNDYASDNTNNNNNINGGKNNVANAIKFEWASHNHHNTHPILIDRNRQSSPPIHHRINYHQQNRNKMNNNHHNHHHHHPSPPNGQQDYDSDDIAYYSSKDLRSGGKRIANGSSSGPSSSLSMMLSATIIVWISSIFLHCLR